MALILLHSFPHKHDLTKEQFMYAYALHIQFEILFFDPVYLTQNLTEHPTRYASIKEVSVRGIGHSPVSPKCSSISL